MTDSQTSSGGRPRRLTGEVLLSVFDEVWAPVATIPMLAEHVDASEETVRRRVNELHEQGEVHRLDAGSTGVVWWPAE